MISDLALHHWKQPMGNMFAVQSLNLWLPEPAEVMPPDLSRETRKYPGSCLLSSRLTGTNPANFPAARFWTVSELADNMQSYFLDRQRTISIPTWNLSFRQWFDQR